VTSPRALALPVAAGLAAAAVTFAVITALDVHDEREGDPGLAAADTRAEAAAGGREVFAKMGCGSCHRFADAGSTGKMGPGLDERLAPYDRASLEATILAPPGSGAGLFSSMPDNFGERMTERELDILVEYLLAARR
jgi:mono/diheme cytochrome c family protein